MSRQPFLQDVVHLLYGGLHVCVPHSLVVLLQQDAIYLNHFRCFEGVRREFTANVKAELGIIIFIICSFLTGYDLNIIFDQVGSYAGAVSFMHLAINADFSLIQVARLQARLALQNYDLTLFRPMDNKLSDLQTPLRHHYIKQNQAYHQLSENRLKCLDQFDVSFPIFVRDETFPPLIRLSP